MTIPFPVCCVMRPITDPVSRSTTQTDPFSDPETRIFSEAEISRHRMAEEEDLVFGCFFFRRIGERSACFAVVVLVNGVHVDDMNVRFLKRDMFFQERKKIV